MIEQTVKNRIKQLPDEYVQFLSSGFIEDATAAFGSELGLDEESLEYLQNGILLYLTLFINHQEFADFLSRECYIPESVAAATAEAIEKSLPDDIQEAVQAGYETLHPNAKTAATQTTHEDLQKEIAETSQGLEQIQSMRTMQTDYQKQSPEASQAKPAPSAPMPKNPTSQPEKKESPRWGSDA